jgi:hypothetical protein
VPRAIPVGGKERAKERVRDGEKVREWEWKREMDHSKFSSVKSILSMLFQCLYGSTLFSGHSNEVAS